MESDPIKLHHELLANVYSLRRMGLRANYTMSTVGYDLGNRVHPMGVANYNTMQLVVLAVLRNLGSHYHAGMRCHWIGCSGNLWDSYSS